MDSPASDPRLALLMPDRTAARLFDDRMRTRLAALSAAAPVVAPDMATLAADPRARGVGVVLTGWGSPRLDPSIKASCPALSLVLHCAGSLRAVVDPLLFDHGVRFSTCADANAIPVAEYLLSWVLRWSKRLDWWAESYRADPATFAERGVRDDIGVYGQTIGVIGASRVGRRLLTLLRHIEVRALLSDPYMTEAEAAALGATLATPQTLLAESEIVALCAPLLPQTRGMIGAAELARMRDGALLINAARGGLVDHAALLAEARTGRLNAVLDVTEPEPLPADSPFFALPNVVVTPHVAGSLGREVRRMGEAALAEAALFLSEGRLRHEVSRRAWEVAA